MKKVYIKRYKVHRRGGKFAWYWNYAIRVGDDGVWTHDCDRLDIARGIVKRLYPDCEVIEVWKNE